MSAIRKCLGAAVAIGLLILAVSHSVPAQDDTVSAEKPGHVQGIDGDTLQIGAQVIHLYGIDAPELGQRCLNKEKVWRCGLEAAIALKKQIAYGDVSCKIEERENGRKEGICSSGGKDLAQVLLSSGIVVVTEDAPPTYNSAQEQAKSSGLGLWRGDFIPPAKWRAGERLPVEEEEKLTCEIKGTIDQKDNRYFYMPEDPGYEDISLDFARGERLFCSDDKAFLSGWSRAPRTR